jgi:hypothetical protein
VAVSFKSVLRSSVKILAVVLAAFGIYVILTQLAPSFRTPMTDYIISGKSIAISDAYCLSFHDPDHPGEIQNYYFTQPRSFYEAAWVGDHLQISTAQSGGMYSGYKRIVRDGHTVARLLSSEQLQYLWLTIVLILPTLVFLPCKSKVLTDLIWATAIVAEICVLAVAVDVTLIAYALKYSHKWHL